MIYFVRHGETDYNIEQIIQGQLDIPLNQTGINQAKELAENIKDIKIDKIYCSPLRRTKTTAEIINKYHNVQIIYDDRLKEFYGGKFQGFRFKDLSPEQKYAIQFEPEKYGAETTEQFYNRTVEFYKEIENLGNYIEYEEDESIKGFDVKEKINILINRLKKINLTLGNDLSCKKVFLKFQKDQNLK